MFKHTILTAAIIMTSSAHAFDFKGKPEHQAGGGTVHNMNDVMAAQQAADRTTSVVADDVSGIVKTDTMTLKERFAATAKLNQEMAWLDTKLDVNTKPIQEVQLSTEDQIAAMQQKINGINATIEHQFAGMESADKEWDLTVSGSINGGIELETNDTDVSGKLVVRADKRIDDPRDSFGVEAGIRANGDGIEPIAGVGGKMQRETYEVNGVVGATEGGIKAGVGVVADLVENEKGGIALAASASIGTDGVSIGPGIEFTGEDCGIMTYATDIQVVERGGPNKAYRKRSSLNPVAIIIDSFMGNDSALDKIKRCTD